MQYKIAVMSVIIVLFAYYLKRSDIKTWLKAIAIIVLIINNVIYKYYN